MIKKNYLKVFIFRIDNGCRARILVSGRVLRNPGKGHILNLRCPTDKG